MHVTSRVELNLQKTPGKAEYITLKLLENAVYLNHQALGQNIYEAIAVLDSVKRELEFMEAARSGRANAEAKAGFAQKEPCTCAARSRKEKSSVPYACSKCVQVLEFDGSADCGPQEFEWEQFADANGLTGRRKKR